MDDERDLQTPEIHCRRAALYAAARKSFHAELELRQAADAARDLAEWAGQVPALHADQARQRC